MTPGEAAVMKASVAVAPASARPEIGDVRVHRAAVAPLDGAGAGGAGHRGALLPPGAASGKSAQSGGRGPRWCRRSR